MTNQPNSTQERNDTIIHFSDEIPAGNGEYTEDAEANTEYLGYVATSPSSEPQEESNN